MDMTTAHHGQYDFYYIGQLAFIYNRRNARMHITLTVPGKKVEPKVSQAEVDARERVRKAKDYARKR
jgi:hypothetical protein